MGILSGRAGLRGNLKVIFSADMKMEGKERAGLKPGL
jgi:hypothetical protein